MPPLPWHPRAHQYALAPVVYHLLGSQPGKVFLMGTHMLTRANLTAVRNEIEYWAGKLAEAEAAEQRGGSPCASGLPSARQSAR